MLYCANCSRSQEIMSIPNRFRYSEHIAFRTCLYLFYVLAVSKSIETIGVIMISPQFLS
jgi:hypothetical protein